MSNEERPHEIETYALILGIDDSLLKANSIFENQGYELIYCSISRLETDFSKLFSTPDKYTSNTSVKLPCGDIVTKEFYNLFITHPLVPFSSEGLFFLNK